MLLAKNKSSLQFKGVDYESVRITQRKTSYAAGNGDSRIADAWNKKVKERVATISLDKIGPVGLVPPKLAVECYGVLEQIQKPPNGFTLFVKSSFAANASTDMYAVGQQWQGLDAKTRGVYSVKAAEAKRRYLMEVSQVCSSFGTSTVDLRSGGAAGSNAADGRKGVYWSTRDTCEWCLRPESKSAGKLLACPRCPSALHAECLPAGAAVNSDGTHLLQCAHHRCAVCKESPSNCGGALLCCTRCTASYCGDHRPKGGVITRRCQWAEELGFDAPRTMIYFECGECE